MATESKDIELRVRARDYSAKTMEQVVDALNDLTKAQQDQLKSAKAGEQSASALEASYKKMEQAVQALVKQNALTETFQKQSEQLAALKNRLEEARQAQSAYAASLAGVDKQTKAQVARTRELAAAVKGAETAQNNAQTRLDRTTASLAKYGIATDQVVKAQAQISAAITSGNAALERQDAAIDAVADNIARKAAADASAAAISKKAADDQAAADRAASEAARKAADIQARTVALVNQVQKAKFDAAKADQAMANAMRVSAQQAEAAAKGYLTLARSVKSVRGDELSKQLASINDPLGTANKNIDSLGKAIDGLKGKVDSIKGPVGEFRQTLAQLEAAQSAGAGIGKSIDAYRRQVDALRAARAEYVSARTAVTALTTQMKAGGADAGELSKQLGAAQNALRNAASAMGAQVTSTRNLRTALKDAGVDTANLAAAESKLINQAKASTSTLVSLTAAYKKYGAAASDAGKSTFSFFESGRTTLSFAQRMRGELLGLATAYIGIQAAVNLARSSLDAYSQTQKINQTLLAATGGDAAAARQEYEYLMATADRLGLVFSETAQAYAKLSIASKAAGMSQQETRFIFEQFASAARAAGLSGFEFEGAMKAVEQILSKGTIQAEELRGQLGDRLAGAFNIAAKAAGLTTGEFSKMMEQGAIGSEYLLNIARELGSTYKLSSEATNGLQAQQARFQNAAFAFQQALAEGGFAEAYTDFLIKLTALLKSDDGKALAQALSGAFSAVIQVLQLLAENIEFVKLAFSALIGVGVAKWALAGFGALRSLVTLLGGMFTAVRGAVAVVGSLAGGIGAIGGAAVTATTAVTGWRLALMLLTRAVPILAAVSAAVMAAMWAYEKLSAAKDKADKKIAEPVRVDAASVRKVDQKFEPTPDPGTGGTAGSRAAAAQSKDLEKNQEKLNKALAAAREQGAKDSLAARKKLIDDEYNLRRNAATKEITDETQRTKVLSEIDKQHKQALLIDQQEFNNQHQSKDESAASKRLRLQEQVKNELARVQDEIAKNVTKADNSSSFEERLKTRVDDVANSYGKLKNTITSLAVFDKAGAAEAAKTLDGYVKQVQALEAFKATQDEIKRLEKELNDQASLGVALREEQKAKLDAALISQEEFLANTAEITKRTDTAVNKAADDLQKFVDAAVAAKAGILSLTEQANVRTKTTTAKADAGTTDNKIFEEQTRVQSEAIDLLTAKRAAAEAVYKAQLDARLIGEDEYALKMNSGAEQYKAQVAAAIALQLQLLEAQRATALLNQTMSASDLAALDQKILKYQALGIQIANAAATQNTLAQYTQQFINQGLDTALDGAATAITNMVDGTQTLGEGFEALGTTVLQFFADFLRQIALAIAKQLILNALASMAGGFGAAAGALGGVASQNHRGGVIGAANGTKTRVNPSWFVGAPRYHEGGFPGLRSDEVPAILQEGEQVLARNDPNNVLNGGQKTGGGGTRFVLVDDRAKIPEAMQSAEGEQVTLMNLQRNIPSVKSMLGIG